MMCDQCHSLRMLEIGAAVWRCEKCHAEQIDVDRAYSEHVEAQARFNDAIARRQEGDDDPDLPDSIERCRGDLSEAHALYLRAIGGQVPPLKKRGLVLSKPRT